MRVSQHPAGGGVSVPEASVRLYPMDSVFEAVDCEAGQLQLGFQLLSFGDIGDIAMPQDAAVFEELRLGEPFAPPEALPGQNDPVLVSPWKKGSSGLLDGCDNLVKIVRV